MEGEDGGDTPPFWLQSNSSNNNRNRRRSSPSNFFLNSGFLIIILAITALFLVFIAVPSFLSFTSQYVKPHLVKKNWDSLNIVLVFFAIICGFLSRRTADDIPAGSGADNGFSNLSSQRALAEEGEREPNQMQFRHRPMSMDQPWIGYSDMNPVTYNVSSTTGNVGGMRRNSSSYPDLRRESLWNPGPERRRFYDDINVDGYQYGGAPDYLHRRHPSDPLPAPVPTEYQYGESTYLLHHNSAPVPATVPESDDTKYFSDTKTIPVDTFVMRQQDESSPEPPPVIEPTEQPPPPSSKTPPPKLPPHAAEIRRKERAERRTFRSVERREEPAEEKKELEFEKVRTRPLIPPPSPPPPAPPPPPPPKPSKSEQKGSKSERKRSGNAAKDIKNTFASLYNQRKNKKKNKQKSRESFDDMFHQLFDEPEAAQSFVGPPPSPPPPPPPPPPPASVFHQLFKKSSKTKKIHSDAAPSPPPTKPSGSSKRRVPNQEPSPSMPENSAPKQIRSPLKPDSSHRKKPSTPGKPPLPASRSSNTYFPSDELYLNNGNQSPLIPMPPPPPPPPFKMSAMKFVVRGDFVRIRSRTSRSGSPELLDDAASAQESPMDTPISTPRVVDSTDGESSIPPSPFFPSPDVDYKADSFIARFRAGLKNGN